MSKSGSNLTQMLNLPQKPDDTEWTQDQKDKYRFGGERYSIRYQTTKAYSYDIIPQVPGLFAYPHYTLTDVID